ncbi:MAG: hypothetical protein J7M30_04515 [Deltaproteobacteria bacterium]|nr:hypothetical protein [Deltaproteobacteria bacterium]
MQKSIPIYITLFSLVVAGALLFVSKTEAGELTPYQVINLEPGWNIVSTPKVILSYEFSVPETSKYLDIYLLDPESPSGWRTLQEVGQTKFEPLYAYFINNKTNQTQTLRFNYNNNLTPGQRLFQRTVHAGWNAVGIALPDEVLNEGKRNKYSESTRKILDLINDSIVLMIDFTADRQNPDSVKIGNDWEAKPNLEPEDLDNLRKLKGYGVFVKETTDKYIGFQNINDGFRFSLADNNPTETYSGSEDETLFIFQIDSLYGVDINSLVFSYRGTGNKNNISNFRLYDADTNELLGLVSDIDDDNTIKFLNLGISCKSGIKRIKLVGDINPEAVHGEVYEFILENATLDNEIIITGLPISNAVTITTAGEEEEEVINFDELSIGQYGNNLTYYDGVTFSTEETAFLVITDGTYDRGHGIEHSDPNKLSVFNPPSDLWIQFDYPVNSVGFWLSGAYKTRTIYAYDSDNNEVTSYIQLYPMEEPLAPDGTPWDVYYDRQEYYINLQGDNITKVLIQAVGYDSFSIDDLTYSPPVARIETGDLRLAKYTAYTDQTLVAPLSAAKLAHFTLTAGTTEAVNLNTIVVDFASAYNTGTFDAASDLSDLYVVYGTNTTTTKATVSSADAGNSWSINYELAAGATIDLIVYADVASGAGAAGVAQASVTVTGTTVQSATSAQGGETAGQLIAFGTGVLTSATAGDTPLDQLVSGSSAADIAAGTYKTITAAKFKFTAQYESYNIEQLKVKINDSTAATISQAILQVVLKDGETVLGMKPLNESSKVDDAGADITNSATTFTGLSVDIPANTTKTLTVDLVLSQPSADSGSSQVDTKITLDYVKVYDSKGVLYTTGVTTDRVGNDIYVFQSIPTFTHVDLTNNVIANGSSSTIYSFKIAADEKGPIAVKQLKFGLDWNDLGNDQTLYRFN